MYCPGERALFSSSLWPFWGDFFLQTYQWCYIIFAIDGSSFLKVIRWTKYIAHRKIRRPKSCLLMFASLVALDGFHLLLSTLLIADLTLEWTSWSMFHPVSHIYGKTPFCCVKIVANNALNRRHVVFIDCEQTPYPLWTRLSHWQNFMQNGEYNAFWYLQLLCYLRQLQFMIGKNKLVEGFFVFSGTTAEFGQPERSELFKVNIPPLNHYFGRSRVRITFITPLLCLDSIISHQKAMLQFFFFVLKICNSSFT